MSSKAVNAANEGLDTAEAVAVLAESEIPLAQVDAELRDEVAAVRTLMGSIAKSDLDSRDLREQRDRLLQRVPAPELAS
jgi:hypothetical protein